MPLPNALFAYRFMTLNVIAVCRDVTIFKATTHAKTEVAHLVPRDCGGCPLVSSTFNGVMANRYRPEPNNKLETTAYELMALSWSPKRDKSTEDDPPRAIDKTELKVAALAPFAAVGTNDEEHFATSGKHCDTIPLVIIVIVVVGEKRTILV